MSDLKLRAEFEEFKEMSAALEAEMEQELSQAQDKCKALTIENDNLRRQLEDLKPLYSQQCMEQESLYTRLTILQETTQEDQRSLRSKVRALETAYDHALLKIREKDAEIERLQAVYTTALDHLGIMTAELDAVQTTSQETTCRLRMDIMDLTQDLQVAKRHSGQANNGQPEPDDSELKRELNVSLESKTQVRMIDELIAVMSGQLQQMEKSRRKESN